jgi:DNA-binding protein HU-beta
MKSKTLIKILLSNKFFNRLKFLKQEEMIKSQFNRYVRDALAKRQKKSNIDEANAVIDVFVEAIKEALSENDEILLVGFGKFIKSKVEARNGINPKTGQPIKIPAYMQPRFKAGIKLKEACNRNEKSKKQ